MIRKTPLRRQSKKRAKSDRASRSALAEFAAEFPFCWCCRSTRREWRPIETHHSCGRAHPMRDDRRLLGRYCRDCHETRWTNPKDKLSPLDRLAQQMAYKLVYDPDFYDLRFVLECKGFAPSAISEADVAILAAKVKENSDG